VIGTKALFLPRLPNYPASEIVVVEDKIAGQMEHFESQLQDRALS
jgi:hypothetical protein